MSSTDRKVLLKEYSPLGLVPASIRKLINNEIREDRLSYSHITTDYNAKDRERFAKVSRVLYQRDGEDVVSDVWRAITSFTFAKFFLLSVRPGTSLYRSAFNWRSTEHIRNWTIDAFTKIRDKGYDSILTWKRSNGTENVFPLSCLYATALFEEHLNNFIDSEWLAVNMICRRESGSKFSTERNDVFFPKTYESDKIRLWTSPSHGELCYYDSDGKVTFQPFSYSFESGRAMGSLTQFCGTYLKSCCEKNLIGEPNWYQDDYAKYLCKRARVGLGGSYRVNTFHEFVAQRVLSDIFEPATTVSRVNAAKTAEVTYITGVTQVFSHTTRVKTRLAVMYKFLSTAAGIRRCSSAYHAPTFQTGRRSIIDLTTRNIADSVFYSGNTALMTGDYPIRWAKMANGYTSDELKQKYPNWLIAGSQGRFLLYRPPSDKDLPTYDLTKITEESLKLERQYTNRVTQVGKEIRAVFKSFSAAEFATLFFKQGSISLATKEAHTSESALTRKSEGTAATETLPEDRIPNTSTRRSPASGVPPTPSVVQSGNSTARSGDGGRTSNTRSYSNSAAGTVYRIRSNEF